MNAHLPEGFTARPMLLDETARAVDLFNAYSMHYLGYNTDTVEDDLAFYQTPGFQVETDTQMVLDPDGQCVGFAEFWDTVEPHTKFNVGVVVHPNWEGKGIGSFLLDWSENRGRTALTSSPAEAKVVIQQGLDAHLVDGIDFLTARGYRIVRNFYLMQIELDRQPPEPQVLAQFSMRPIDGEEERREAIHSLWESFHDHWGFVDEPFENYYRRWEHWANTIKGMDPSMWYLVKHGDEIAGACLCSTYRPDDPDMGWISQLGIRRKYRKNGLGLAFLQMAFAEFYRRGKKRVGLGVDADSLTGATRLYEKAGMHIARRQHTLQKVIREGVDISTQTLAVTA